MIVGKAVQGRWISLFLLLVAGLLAGCGGSHDNAVGQGNASVPLADTATIRLVSALERAVPSAVDGIRLTGYNAERHAQYGPVTQSKAATIDFPGVPVGVTQVIVEYLEGPKVVGLAQATVALEAGETFVLSDLDFEDIASGITSLTVEPGTASLAQGTSRHYSAIARFSDGSTLNVSSMVSWSSSNPSVATIANGTALATAGAVGTTQITAAVWGLTSNSVELEVTAATVTGLEVRGASDISAFLPVQLSAIALLSNGDEQDVTGTASWSSAYPDTATVDDSANKGLVSGHGAGQAVITASYLGFTADHSVTVSLVPLAITADATFNTDTGLLNGQPFAGWNPQTKQLIVTSFSVPANVSLRIEGSQTFDIAISGSTAISGTINFRGAAGSVGGASSGHNGGSVRITTPNSITGHGRIWTDGGDGADGGEGGDGGDIEIDCYGVRLLQLSAKGGAASQTVAGTGGGAGGDISVRSSVDVDVDGGVITSGGVGYGEDGAGRDGGGSAGDIVLFAERYFYVPITTAKGGDDPAPGQGRGGDGGDITITVLTGNTGSLNDVRSTQGGDRSGPGTSGNGGNILHPGLAVRPVNGTFLVTAGTASNGATSGADGTITP